MTSPKQSTTPEKKPISLGGAGGVCLSSHTISEVLQSPERMDHILERIIRHMAWLALQSSSEGEHIPEADISVPQSAKEKLYKGFQAGEYTGIYTFLDQNFVLHGKNPKNVLNMQLLQESLDTFHKNKNNESQSQFDLSNVTGADFLNHLGYGISNHQAINKYLPEQELEGYEQLGEINKLLTLGQISIDQYLNHPTIGAIGKENDKIDQKKDILQAMMKISNGGYAIGRAIDQRIVTEADITQIFHGKNEFIKAMMETSNGGYAIGRAIDQRIVTEADITQIFHGKNEFIKAMMETSNGGYVIGAAIFHDMITQDDIKQFGGGQKFIKAMMETSNGGYVIGAAIYCKMITEADITQIFHGKNEFIKAMMETSNGGYVIGAAIYCKMITEADIIQIFHGKNEFIKAMMETSNGGYAIDEAIDKGWIVTEAIGSKTYDRREYPFTPIELYSVTEVDR